MSKLEEGKKEEKDNWVYQRTNSKGEKKFNRYTGEDLKFAVDFLEKKGG